MMTTTPQAALPSRDDGSIVVGVGFTLPILKPSALLIAGASGVFFMVAGVMYSYLIGTNTRIDRLAETQQQTLYSMQQSIQSMNLSLKQQQGGGDFHGPSPPSTAIHDEWEEPSLSDQSFMGYATATVALLICTLLAVVAIERHFGPLLRAVLPNFQEPEPELSTDQDSSYSNRLPNSTNLMQQLSPSKRTRSDDGDFGMECKTKRARCQSVAFDAPKTTNANIPPTAPSLPWFQQAISEASPPLLGSLLPQPAQRAAVHPPRHAPTAAMATPMVARSASIWMNPGAAPILPAAAAQSDGGGEKKVSKKEKLDAIRARLALEYKLLNATKARRSPVKDESAATPTKRTTRSPSSRKVKGGQSSPAADGGSSPNQAPPITRASPRKKTSSPPSSKQQLHQEMSTKQILLQEARARVRENPPGTKVKGGQSSPAAATRSSPKQGPTTRASPQKKSRSPPSSKQSSHQEMSAKQLKLQEVRARVRANQHLIRR